MVNETRLRDLYFKLISIPSVVGNESEIAHYLADCLTAMGLSTRLQAVGERSFNVVADVGGRRDGPTLLLCGHLDTVPVADGWVTDPFKPVLEGDRVYGLGAMDMKGGLAAIVEAVSRVLEEGRERLRGRIVLGFVACEEALSEGVHELIQGQLDADFGIMAECRFSNIAIGFRGRYSIQAVFRGTAAHSSLYPQVGLNAIIDACRFVVEAEKVRGPEHPRMPRGTTCVREIRGGSRVTLSVPDRCEVFMDRFVTEGENLDGVIAQYRGLATSLGMADRVDIRLVPRKTPYCEPFMLDERHPIVKALTGACQRVMRYTPPLVCDPSVCDSNYLVTLAGIPTVTFGPSGGNMHGANEYGILSEVKAASEIYLDVIGRLLTGKAD